MESVFFHGSRFGTIVAEDNFHLPLIQILDVSSFDTDASVTKSEIGEPTIYSSSLEFSQNCDVLIRVFILEKLLIKTLCDGMPSYY